MVDVNSIAGTSQYRQTAADEVTSDEVRRSTNGSPLTAASSEMGRDEFFKLLTTQMVNQDPLEPMKDTDFIAQMANFSSLEQVKQLNEHFLSFSQQQTMNEAQGYLGKVVSLTDEAGEPVEGVVTEVSREAEGFTVTIGDKEYDGSSIYRVSLVSEN